MDPNKKIVNGSQDFVTETDDDQEIENEHITEPIVASEPHIPDVTGLNTDTSFVNSVNDAEEPES